MFDGNAVDNWWKSALVFKVYARSAGQKVVGNNKYNKKQEIFQNHIELM